ncbi:tripartite motif-containing protein 2/3 [Mytilus galloprovincialis]|uniref:Tripartite motif-containing protein 2/3 n=2 Tax=Mytilus galloprovincialis TaxID=29158 RepID=A0A8B6D6T6_MYTGA|nr:tripartite motif-containing protein 2/3 [Mytilus galloprovincialis]
MMHLLRNKLLGESSTRKVAMERQKLIRRVGKRGKCKGQFMNPCGVAVSKAGDIIIADTENHRIQIFTTEGVFKSKFGCKGCKPDQIHYPVSVVMTKDDHVAITDSVNACVKIFSLDGQLVQLLGSSDVLEIPYGLCLTHDDYFIVTDICKHSLVIFDKEGNMCRTFGQYGSEPRDFDHPYFVAVDTDKQIYVSDSGNSSIKLFTFEGKLLRCYSQTDFKLNSEVFFTLNGICIDGEGNVLVACNSGIYILLKNGRLWEVLTSDEGLTCPKCITVSSCGKIIVTQNNGEKINEFCIFRYNPENFRSLNSAQFYAINI